ncbi:MAG: hypothetical protein QM621_09040 [Aeromicrobium sp.]|uniref:hypothetical protein n=1 Tax=Aeromicrobium sp. TaxID=1871063 RepID=UPI0039E52FA6
MSIMSFGTWAPVVPVIVALFGFAAYFHRLIDKSHQHLVQALETNRVSDEATAQQIRQEAREDKREILTKLAGETSQIRATVEKHREEAQTGQQEILAIVERNRQEARGDHQDALAKMEQNRRETREDSQQSREEMLRLFDAYARPTRETRKA